MKNRNHIIILIVLFAFIVLLTSCVNFKKCKYNNTDEGQIVEFVNVEGYICKKSSLPINYFVIKKQDEFDSTFQAKWPPYDPSKITKINLINFFIISIVKKG